MPRWQWGSYLVLAGFVLLPRTGFVRADFLDTLPRYDLSIDLDVDHQAAHVRQLVTWTNCARRPAHELVFNAHSHYQLPGADVGFLAKMLEILHVLHSARQLVQEWPRDVFGADRLLCEHRSIVARKLLPDLLR